VAQVGKGGTRGRKTLNRLSYLHDDMHACTNATADHRLCSFKKDIGNLITGCILKRGTVWQEMRAQHGLKGSIIKELQLTSQSALSLT
jgi:hypothetical protein